MSLVPSFSRSSSSLVASVTRSTPISAPPFGLPSGAEMSGRSGVRKLRETSWHTGSTSYLISFLLDPVGRMVTVENRESLSRSFLGVHSLG